MHNEKDEWECGEREEGPTNMNKWSAEGIVFKQGLIDGDNVRSVIAKSHLIN